MVVVADLFSMMIRWTKVFMLNHSTKAKIGCKNTKINLHMVSEVTVFFFFWIISFGLLHLRTFTVNAVKTDDNANVTSDQNTNRKYEDDSSEFSSELEEVYEQFSKWLDDPIIKENVDILDPRDEAVLNFASSLLKRTLSESYVGVPLTEGCISSACKLTWQREKTKVFSNHFSEKNYFIHCELLLILNFPCRYSSRREFDANLSR